MTALREEGKNSINTLMPPALPDLYPEDTLLGTVYKCCLWIKRSKQKKAYVWLSYGSVRREKIFQARWFSSPEVLYIMWVCIILKPTYVGKSKKICKAIVQ